jgi:hypothetical protein
VQLPRRVHSEVSQKDSSFIGSARSARPRSEVGALPCSGERRLRWQRESRQKVGALILMGHSQGGNDAIEIARALEIGHGEKRRARLSGLARKSSIEGNGGDPAMLPSAERQEGRERDAVERDFEKLRRRRLAAVVSQLRALLLAHTRTQTRGLVEGWPSKRSASTWRP